MKRRAVPRALTGQDVCLFCAFRPRVDRQLRRSAPLSTNLRSFHASRPRAQQAAAKQSDHDDESNFSMLKKNAELSAAFPTRAKAKPPSPPPSPSTLSSPVVSRTPYGIKNESRRQDTLSSGLGDTEQRQQRTPRRYGGRDEDFQDRRDNQAQAPFRIRTFSANDNSQPGRKYGQDRTQDSSRKFGQSGYDNRSQPAEQEQTGFRIHKVGIGRADDSFNTEGRDVANQARPKPSYGFQARPNGKDMPSRYSERSPQGETSNDRGGFRSRQPYNRDVTQSQQESAYPRENSRFGQRSGSREPHPGNQRPNNQQDFNARAMRGRNDDYGARQQDGFRPRFGDRSHAIRDSNERQDKSASEIASTIEGNSSGEFDGIEAPAGSSFDSAFGGRESRRGVNDRRNKRNDRFEELDEEGIESAPPPVRSKAKPQSQGFNFELAEAEEMLYGGGNKKKKKSKAPKPIQVQSSRPPVQLPEFVSVERLARILKVNLDQFVAKLEEEGFEGARYDHVLDASTSSMFADLYGFEPMVGGSGPVEDLGPRPPPEDVSLLPPRPPIVTIMGHVDHGKTTILDFLRKSSVVATEHGGITQHIGAFSVTMPGTNRQITFLDTPGHAAFLEMRRRGANVTDIVVLVVAADDSVKPQTIEAIKHALEANVQLIVAINKVDKQDADIERVKQDLTRHDIVVEDYGGDYQVIPVSGKTGQGMDALEEAILTLADVSDYRAETDGPAEGWVLESKVTAAGRVATILVRRGTLRTGDFIVAGTTWARVRTLRNDAGILVTEAPPGTPVQVDGWRAGDPDAGLEVFQADGEDHAKDVVDLRLEQQETAKTATDLAALNTTRSEDAEARAKVLAWEAEQTWAKKGYALRPLDNAGWVEMDQASGLKQVPFVIKADVAGSAEAVAAAVVAVGNNEITAHVIHNAVGELTEFDIRRLAATGEVGFAINFNQPVDSSIARLAAAANIRILNHNIIYKVTDDVKERLAAELPPIITQRVVGEAEIGQVFDITVKRNKIKIAGCRVTNGTIARTSKIRVLRSGETIYTGTLHSLKNVKRDVAEMRKGTECGMGFNDWEDFQEGDQIQCFEEHEEKRTLY